MDRMRAILLGGSFAVLCAYAATVPLSEGMDWWVGVAMFVGVLVGIAGAIICRMEMLAAILCGILGALSVDLAAYNIFYRGNAHFVKVHDVAWFAILGSVMGVFLCWVARLDKQR